MSDPNNILAAMRRAADQIEAENDNFLRAIVMIAANGRAQIIPTDNGILGPTRALICLPKRQYDRLIKITQNQNADSAKGGRDD